MTSVKEVRLEQFNISTVIGAPKEVGAQGVRAGCFNIIPTIVVFTIKFKVELDNANIPEHLQMQNFNRARFVRLFF